MIAASTLERFVLELVAGAVVLDSLDEAAAAEAWASGALAEWVALGGEWGELSRRIPEGSAPLAAGIIGYLEGSQMSPVSAGWASDVGNHELVEAVRVSGDDEEVAIIVGYEAPSGARHDASVSIVRGEIVDLSLGPSGLATAASEHEAGSLRATNMSTTVAQALIRSALEDADPEGLSESARLNLAVMLRRFDLDGLRPNPRSSTRAIPERNIDDDRYAAELMRSSLRLAVDAALPDEVQLAHTRFVALLNGGEPDAATILEIVGSSGDFERGEPSMTEFLGLVGAYVAPADLSAHDPQSQQAIVGLESADWLGAILGAVRSGSGTMIDGEALVRFINKCPEVETTIPRRDAPGVAWAFDQILYAWEITGVLDDAGALTTAGQWLLPRSAIAAWRPDR